MTDELDFSALDSVETSTSDDEEPTFSTDSPVAVTQSLSSPDYPTYGSERDDIRPVDEETRSSDDVDVRGLFNDPTVDMLRWLYRQQGSASTVVDKPVEDAFKHGFTLDSATTNIEQTTEKWLKETYVPKLKDARIKARRDGFAVLFWKLSDSTSISESPENVTEIVDLHVWDLSKLATGRGNPRNTEYLDSHASAEKAADHTEYDEAQLVVTQHGLVVVDDITHEDHEEVVGCMYERNPKIDSDEHVVFVHGDRMQTFTARPHVDGDVHDEAYGYVEGDSVLTPILHPLLGLTKAEWALGQTLLRYSAPLHVVEMDETVQPAGGDMKEHLDELNENLDGITNKSNISLPPGHELDTHGANEQLDPGPFVETLLNQISAGSEITKSVLLGTQAGTVSGSSTDIKNYYNQVERDRENIYEADMREAVRMASRFDPSVVPRFTLNFAVKWEPLFKIDAVDRTESMSRVVQAVNQGVGKYIFTPEDAQDILEQEWAKLDIDVELEELSEEQMDQLDRINTGKSKQFARGESSENEVEGNPRSGNTNLEGEGGREAGQTTDPSSPTSAGTDSD